MHRSPRFIRPHSVVLNNMMGELDGNAVYHKTILDYVNADASYAIKQSQKGIQAEGDLLVVVDVNDIVAYDSEGRAMLYMDAFDFEKSEDPQYAFTFRPDIDIITYKNHDYTVVSICEKSPKGNTPTFIEVVAKRSE